MNRILGVIVVALVASACATNSSVKQQTDPLNTRLTAVESQLAEMNRKLDAQTVDLQAAQKTLADTNAAAQAAQQAAQAAQQAAADAQAASTRAETAADKAAKAFELGQRKGR
jgi:hypothetical protein